MVREDIGICEACREEFTYRLIHNGFNDSAFAYCDHCGCTAMLSGWHDAIPHSAKLKVHGPVNAEAEALLERCPCGGTFRATNRMREALAARFSLTDVDKPPFRETLGLKERIHFYVHTNPGNKILHTALVGDMNGLVHVQTLGTPTNSA